MGNPPSPKVPVGVSLGSNADIVVNFPGPTGHFLTPNRQRLSRGARMFRPRDAAYTKELAP